MGTAFKRQPVFQFILTIIVFFTMLTVGRAEKCAVCGQDIMGETIYIYTDKLTGEKKSVCYNCSMLPDVCFVCGMPVKNNITRLSDGRVLCARDAKNAVLDPNEAKHICEDVQDELDRLFSRFTTFPTNVDVDVVDRISLLALFKVPGNDYECPDVLGYFRPRTNHHVVRFKVSLMSALSRGELRATCAHELSHAWVAANVSSDRRDEVHGDAEEGFCELVAYLLMDSEHDEAEKKVILKNGYTRGQVELFIQAEKRYGFNDVLDWMKWGTDTELGPDEPNRIRDVEMPRAKPASPAPTAKPIIYAAEPISVPDTLVLKGIFGPKGHAVAMINDQSLAVGDWGPVHVGKTNVFIRCLAIGDDSARIQISGSKQEQVLRLNKKPNP